MQLVGSTFWHLCGKLKELFLVHYVYAYLCKFDPKLRTKYSECQILSTYWSLKIYLFSYIYYNFCCVCPQSKMVSKNIVHEKDYFPCFCVGVFSWYIFLRCQEYMKVLPEMVTAYFLISVSLSDGRFTSNDSLEKKIKKTAT